METRDIPQTNRLERIRAVLDAVEDGGADALSVDERTGIGARHANYALATARILGWLNESSRTYSLTVGGRALLRTKAGSPEEQRLFRQAVLATAVVRECVPTLLEAMGPSGDEVAAALQRRVTDISESTAKRRAQTLMSWREQALAALQEERKEPTQKPLPLAVPAPSSAAPAAPPAAPAAASPTPAELPSGLVADLSSIFAMKPRQMKVKELAELKRDGKLFLPDLQRGFVWNNERVRALHDSLYRGYPIGALLLWKPTWEGGDAPFSTRSWDLCPANSEGKGVSERTPPVRPGAVFVLDGQQRLTSLFRVIFKNRFKGRKTRDPDLRAALAPLAEWVNQPFHINSTQLHQQLKDGLIIPAEVLFAGLRGELESAAVQEAIGEWVTPGSALFLKALDRANAIRNAVLNAEILAYEIDADVDDDNVIEVFARLNQQGVRLRPSDLAAARLTGSMSQFRSRARESLSEADFQEFGGGEDLGDEVARTGGQVDTDLLVRTALFLGTGVLRYRDIEKRRRVGGEDSGYAQVEGGWEAAVRGVKAAVKVLRTAGVPSGAWVPYRYVLLVPAVAAARGMLHDTDWWLGWILTASLWGHYSGAAETVAQADAKLAAEGNYQGLLENIKKNAKRTVSVLPDESDFTQNIVRMNAVQLALLVNLVRQDGVSFPSGARFRGSAEPVEIHHIFARNHLDEDTDGTIAPDRIGNLTPLLRSDNEHLKDAPAADYLANILRRGNTDQLRHHDIPQAPQLWEADRFGDFCEEREKMVAKTITNLLGTLLKL